MGRVRPAKPKKTHPRFLVMAIFALMSWTLWSVFAMKGTLLLHIGALAMLAVLCTKLFLIWLVHAISVSYHLPLLLFHLSLFTYYLRSRCRSCSCPALTPGQGRCRGVALKRPQSCRAAVSGAGRAGAHLPSEFRLCSHVLQLLLPCFSCRSRHSCRRLFSDASRLIKYFV